MARPLLRQTLSFIRLLNYRDMKLQKSRDSTRNLMTSVSLQVQNTKDREDDKLNQLMLLDQYFNRDRKNKEMFVRIIEGFEKKKYRTGLVEFIRIATKRMKDYGVHEDLEMYKKLMNLLPKGPMVCTNTLLSDTVYYPKHQFCILELLCHMELYDVMPDREMHTILVQTFGKHARPTMKYLRMMYWGPKFKNINPWPKPDPRPTTPEAAAILAIERIGSVDLENEVSVFSVGGRMTSEDTSEQEDTWIVSGQSPTQQTLIHYHPENIPMYVEGPFNQYLGKKDLVHYFVLRSDMPKNRRRRKFKNPDDIKNLNIPFLDPPTQDDLIPEFSVHEQRDGIIFAIGATGTESSSSLLSWIRLLQKNGNPRLSKIPILFRLTSDGNESSENLLRLEATEKLENTG